MADANKTLKIELESGTIDIELLADVAPAHVERIVKLAEDGAYDGVAFHRVIDGFMAQTGDVQHANKNKDYNPGRAGTGGSSHPDIPAEFSKLPFDRGVCGMARSSNPNSANSQFFIMFDDGHFLNGQYTVWGRVTSGMEHVDALARGEPPADPDHMVSVKVEGADLMLRRTFLALIAAVGVSGPLAAQDANDILVLEIEGKANGAVEIELLSDLAPNHVARIKDLAGKGAYDNVAFHRVIEGFMAQTGDVTFGKKDAFAEGRAGFGGSELPDLAAEFSAEPYVEGIVGMARSQDPDSANSQFFIMFAEAPFLNNQYTVVGRVVSGMEIVHEIQLGAGQNGMVSNPDYIASATIKGER